MIEYAFGSWLPDRKDFRNPGLELAKNVIPGPDGYNPARVPTGSGATISGTIIGATSIYLDDDTIIFCVATTADLYVVRNNTVNASSLSLSINSIDSVFFEMFGVKVYATTKGGDTWVLDDVNTDNTFSAAAGSPPNGNAIGRIGDFLVMGDLTDIDASDAPYRLRWSAFNDPGSNWVTDIGKQSGAVDLNAKYGPVTGIVGGVYGLVFQRRAVTRFTPNGSPSVFNRETFERERGCIAPSSIVPVGERVFYLSHDGFYSTTGVTPTPISTSKVWGWFKDQVHDTYIDYVQGALDFENRCVVWAFPTTGARGPTGLLYFYWEREEWSYVDQAVDWLVQGGNSGTTLSQLDTQYGNLDAIPISLDARELSAEARNLQAVVSGELSQFLGATKEATWTTGDFQPAVGRRTFISEVTPLITTDTANVSLGCRDRMTAQIVQSDTVAMGPIGFAPMNHDARYFRVTITIPAGAAWEDAFGFQIETADSGAV